MQALRRLGAVTSRLSLSPDVPRRDGRRGCAETCTSPRGSRGGGGQQGAARRQLRLRCRLRRPRGASVAARIVGAASSGHAAGRLSHARGRTASDLSRCRHILPVPRGHPGLSNRNASRFRAAKRLLFHGLGSLGSLVRPTAATPGTFTLRWVGYHWSR